MLRLLQGDVGSGKTLVAALAALPVIQAGFQVALMAPTELLSEQHAAQFSGVVPSAGHVRRMAHGLNEGPTGGARCWSNSKTGPVKWSSGHTRCFRRRSSSHDLGWPSLMSSTIRGSATALVTRKRPAPDATPPHHDSDTNPPHIGHDAFR